MGLDEAAASLRGDENLAARWDRETTQARRLFMGHEDLGGTAHEAWRSQIRRHRRGGADLSMTRGRRCTRQAGLVHQRVGGRRDSWRVVPLGPSRAGPSGVAREMASAGSGPREWACGGEGRKRGENMPAVLSRVLGQKGKVMETGIPIFRQVMVTIVVAENDTPIQL